MAIKVIRFQNPSTSSRSHTQWGVVFDRHIAVLQGSYETTADLVTFGLDEARGLTRSDATLPLTGLQVLSPVTANQQFLCQGVNYESHVRESGMDPEKIPFNTIFTKASSCMTGAYDDILCPRQVQLLDYEIELGLVMKTGLTGEQIIRADRLHEVLAGVTIVNDVSARDIQLPQIQFYKGKSYRTFGPVGPFLLLLEPKEWLRWPELRMRLDVNGQNRQDALCGEMIHKPHETLSELSATHDLNPGDLIATGTPAGCASKAPGKVPMFIARHFLSEQTKWSLFIKKGRKNPLFLRPNDVMTLSIGTADGALDLGFQRNRITLQGT
jgi:2,4-didehydro-3-deoxy-L-rhamnonate hydrolase